MISPDQLTNRSAMTYAATDREREVIRLVCEYYAGAKELPSYGWLSRRLNISRQRAHAIMARFKERQSSY